MRTRRFGMIGLVLGSWLWAGCSSSPASTDTVKEVLRGTYAATTVGTYLEMTFYDSEHYALLTSLCGSSDVEACSQSGTYAVDVQAGVLALRDAVTGKVVELPFTFDGEPALVPRNDGLRVQGGSLTAGSGTSLTSGSGSSIVVGDGGALTGDGGSLTTDGGSNVAPGYQAGNQNFQQSDGGAGMPSLPSLPSLSLPFDAASFFHFDAGSAHDAGHD